MRKFFTIILLLTVSLFADNKHKIDKECAACLDTNITTVGMKECLIAAIDKWDAELNVQYSHLMKKLTPAQKTAVKEAQRKWIAYRDAQHQAEITIYGSFGGTMYGITILSQKLELIRSQTLKLQGMAEAFEEY